MLIGSITQRQCKKGKLLGGKNTIMLKIKVNIFWKFPLSNTSKSHLFKQIWNVLVCLLPTEKPGAFLLVFLSWPRVKLVPLRSLWHNINRSFIFQCSYHSYHKKAFASSYLGIPSLFYTYITQSSWFCLTAMWRGESPWMFTACRSDLFSSSSWAISSQPENAAQWRQTFSS